MFTAQFSYVRFGIIRIELEYCIFIFCSKLFENFFSDVQGGSNMTGTDLCVNKPHCAAAARP